MSMTNIESTLVLNVGSNLTFEYYTEVGMMLLAHVVPSIGTWFSLALARHLTYSKIVHRLLIIDL